MNGLFWHLPLTWRSYMEHIIETQISNLLKNANTYICVNMRRMTIGEFEYTQEHGYIPQPHPAPHPNTPHPLRSMIQPWTLQWRHNERDGVWNHWRIDCLTVCLGADQRKHQSSASLAFVRGIHRWSMDSPHKGPATRIIFPFDVVTMNYLRFNKK